MEMDQSRPWFKYRSYSHSLYPVSPEGWLTVLVWLLILIGGTLVMMVMMVHTPPGDQLALFAVWAVVCGLDTAAFFGIRHIKSQQPYWREWRTRRAKDRQDRRAMEKGTHA